MVNKNSVVSDVFFFILSQVVRFEFGIFFFTRNKCHAIALKVKPCCDDDDDDDVAISITEFNRFSLFSWQS